MKLSLITILPAVGLGYLVGGRLRGLSTQSVRWWPAAIAGVLLQVAPASGGLGLWLLLGSFVLLLGFVLVNLRLAGFALVLVGLGLNFLVIAVNGGMPVTRHALVASGQGDTLQDLVEEGGAKHHLADEDSDLLFLGDVIPVGDPVNRAISVGDVGTHAGVTWFIVAGMSRGRRGSEAERAGTTEPEEVAGERNA